MARIAFGKYQLIAELGQGGMADVFLAVQAGPAGSGFKKLTVIKRLRTSLAEEPEFVAMLLDEARIAARLNHPNVVQTHEVGEVDGQYFIAMEYLDGQPLHRIQNRSSQRRRGGGVGISNEQQYLVLMGALSGLHHAHELRDFDKSPLGVVHRDVTPHNIIVTYEGQVKVVDFGIAKAVGRSAETQQGVVKGKLRYMAPEQASGRAIDRTADLFSVGIMLWGVAAGRSLWKGMDDLQIVQALVTGEFPRGPRDVEPSAPPDLDAVCRKALAQRPEERYSTAEEFRIALEGCLDDDDQLAAQRSFPAALGELFKDERKATRGVIEKQLTSLNERNVTSSTAPLPRAKAASVRRPSPTRKVRVIRDPVVGQDVSQADRTLPSATSRRRPPGLRAGLGAVVVAALAAMAWHQTRVTADHGPPPADLDGIVHVKISVLPPGALITLDDEPPRVTPMALTTRRDGQGHRVRIEAEGYVSHAELVIFERDVSMNVELIRLTEPPGAGAAREQRSSPSTPSTSTPTPPGRPSSTKSSTVSAGSGSPAASTSSTEPRPLGIDKSDPWNKD